jgi:hypothetical protein
MATTPLLAMPGHGVPCESANTKQNYSFKLAPSARTRDALPRITNWYTYTLRYTRIDLLATCLICNFFCFSIYSFIDIYAFIIYLDNIMYIPIVS